MGGGFQTLNSRFKRKKSFEFFDFYYIDDGELPHELFIKKHF